MGRKGIFLTFNRNFLVLQDPTFGALHISWSCFMKKLTPALKNWDKYQVASPNKVAVNQRTVQSKAKAKTVHPFLLPFPLRWVSHLTLLTMLEALTMFRWSGWVFEVWSNKFVRKLSYCPTLWTCNNGEKGKIKTKRVESTWHAALGYTNNTTNGCGSYYASSNHSHTLCRA